MLKFIWLFLFILCGCTSSQSGGNSTHSKEGTIEYLVYDSSDNLISPEQITHLLIGTPQTIKVKFNNQKRSVKLNAVMKQITDGKEVNANISLISLTTFSVDPQKNIAEFQIGTADAGQAVLNKQNYKLYFIADKSENNSYEVTNSHPVLIDLDNPSSNRHFISYKAYDNKSKEITPGNTLHLLLGVPQDFTVNFTGIQKNVHLSASLKQIIDGREVDATKDLISPIHFTIDPENLKFKFKVGTYDAGETIPAKQYYKLYFTVDKDDIDEYGVVNDNAVSLDLDNSPVKSKINYQVLDSNGNVVNKGDIIHLILGYKKLFKFAFTGQKRAVKISATLKQIVDGKEVDPDMNLLSTSNFTITTTSSPQEISLGNETTTTPLLAKHDYKIYFNVDSSYSDEYSVDNVNAPSLDQDAVRIIPDKKPISLARLTTNGEFVLKIDLPEYYEVGHKLSLKATWKNFGTVVPTSVVPVQIINNEISYGSPCDIASGACSCVVTEGVDFKEQCIFKVSQTKLKSASSLQSSNISITADNAKMLQSVDGYFVNKNNTNMRLVLKNPTSDSCKTILGNKFLNVASFIIDPKRDNDTNNNFQNFYSVSIENILNKKLFLEDTHIDQAIQMNSGTYDVGYSMALIEYKNESLSNINTNINFALNIKLADGNEYYCENTNEQFSYVNNGEVQFLQKKMINLTCKDPNSVNPDISLAVATEVKNEALTGSLFGDFVCD